MKCCLLRETILSISLLLIGITCLLFSQESQKENIIVELNPTEKITLKPIQSIPYNPNIDVEQKSPLLIGLTKSHYYIFDDYVANVLKYDLEGNLLGIVFEQNLIEKNDSGRADDNVFCFAVNDHGESYLTGLRYIYIKDKTGNSYRIKNLYYISEIDFKGNNIYSINYRYLSKKDPIIKIYDNRFHKVLSLYVKSGSFKSAKAILNSAYVARVVDSGYLLINRLSNRLYHLDNDNNISTYTLDSDLLNARHKHNINVFNNRENSKVNNDIHEVVHNVEYCDGRLYFHLHDDVANENFVITASRDFDDIKSVYFDHKSDFILLDVLGPKKPRVGDKLIFVTLTSSNSDSYLMNVYEM